MCVKKKKIIPCISEITGHTLGQVSVDRKSELHLLPKCNKTKNVCIPKECTLKVSYLQFEKERNKRKETKPKKYLA